MTMTSPRVVSVNISEKKGTTKTPVPLIDLKIDHGIVGDAHAGNWHRQVSLLAIESLNKMKEQIPSLKPGDFAENIMTKGLTLHTLPVGTIIDIGEVSLEVTQIGKKCHAGCQIQTITGECIMPTEGIFAIVKKEGQIKAGDEVKVRVYDRED